MTRIARSIVAIAVLFNLTLPAAAQAPVPVGAPFTLRLGETAAIEGAGATVRFDRVTDDSRCPIDVMCVWAGVFRMVLVVTGSTAGKGTEMEVTLDTMGAEGDASGLHFVLLRVKPARLSVMGAGTAMPYAVLIRADRTQ